MTKKEAIQICTFCLQSIIKLNMCHLVFWQIQQENGAYKCLMIDGYFYLPRQENKTDKKIQNTMPNWKAYIPYLQLVWQKLQWFWNFLTITQKRKMDQSFILRPAGEIQLQKGGGITLKLGGGADFFVRLKH